MLCYLIKSVYIIGFESSHYWSQKKEALLDTFFFMSSDFILYF